MKGATVALALSLALALAVACSADPPCVLGTRGWCENEMAALAMRTVVGTGPDQVRADEVAVVAEGFAVETRRYGEQKVVALEPDEVQRFVAGRTDQARRVTVVISNVHVVNAAGPGNVAAQGTAMVTVYQGGQKVRVEAVSGRLVGGTWTLGERRVVEGARSQL